MSGFDVTIGDMDLIRQVFERQKEHLAAIGTYVESTCRVPGALTGVLTFVAGDYDGAVGHAEQGYQNGQTIAEACATKTAETKAALLKADKDQYDRFAQHERALGHDVPPYKAPDGGGTLGPADSSASAEPGAEKKWKIDSTYPERLKKVGEVLGYDPNDPFKRSGPNGADYLDMKYWAKRGVEAATDHVRGPQYTPTHRAPLPTLPEDTGSTIKGAASIITTPISAINNGYGIVVAGQHVQAAQATHESVQASVDGPSNSAGIDWANSDNGGGW